MYNKFDICKTYDSSEISKAKLVADAECKKLDSIHHAWWQPDMNAVGGKYGHLLF